MLGLLPPLLLGLISAAAFVEALRRNRKGLTGDAVICSVFGWFVWFLAASYVCGYGVAKWLS
jgi:hypothetical protein